MAAMVLTVTGVTVLWDLQILQGAGISTTCLENMPVILCQEVFPTFPEFDMKTHKALIVKAHKHLSNEKKAPVV